MPGCPRLRRASAEPAAGRGTRPVPRGTAPRAFGPAHASGPKHGTWSRVMEGRRRERRFRPGRRSVRGRTYVRARQPHKRPGDATTSRGMAPKVELRRITTIPAFACPNDRGMQMARVSVEVPAELVDTVRETVLLLYGATAESLHLVAEDACGRGRAAVDRRGAPSPPPPRRPGRAARASSDVGGAAAPCRARRATLLHDALYGALIDAGERLAETSNALLARRASARARAGGGGGGARRSTRCCASSTRRSPCVAGAALSPCR